MITFQPGQYYACNSIGDSNCWWVFLVLSRTAKTITIQEVSDREPSRRKIGPNWDNSAECVAPLGSYSMAPTLTAQEPVTVMHRAKDGNRQPYATREQAEAAQTRYGGTVEDIAVRSALLTEADAIRIIAGRDDWTIAELHSLRARCDAYGQERVGEEMDRVNRRIMAEIDALDVAVNDGPRACQDALSRASARWGGAVEVVR